MYIQTLSETWETNLQSVIVQNTWPFKLQLKSSLKEEKKRKRKTGKERKKQINMYIYIDLHQKTDHEC
jgi:hypothetical protein